MWPSYITSGNLSGGFQVIFINEKLSQAMFMEGFFAAANLWEISYLPSNGGVNKESMSDVYSRML